MKLLKNIARLTLGITWWLILGLSCTLPMMNPWYFIPSTIVLIITLGLIFTYPKELSNFFKLEN